MTNDDSINQIEQQLKRLALEFSEELEEYKESPEGIREKALLDIATCCYGSWKYLQSATTVEGLKFQDVVYAISKNIQDVTGYTIGLQEWDHIAELMVLQSKKGEQ